MESARSCDCNLARTRLQEQTRKRSSEERLKQDAELKRQKKMFAPREVIGPRDILVNSNAPKIKLEEDVGSSGISSVKQELLEDNSASEVSSTVRFVNSNQTKIKLEANSHISSEVEEMLEEFTLGEHFDQSEDFDNETDVEHKVNISEMETSDNLPETASESEDKSIFQSHIEQLEVSIYQKEQEINRLLEVIKGLQQHLDPADNMSYDPELENDQLVLFHSSCNKSNVIQSDTSENACNLAKLASDLMKKHAQIRKLTLKMLELQDKLFSTASHNLEVSKNYKTSTEFVQESFKMILPFLYIDLQLNDILTCRAVCRSWRNATDLFLNAHSSTMPFDKETHEKEKLELERGRVPIWNVSPLKILQKAYRFSTMGALKEFTDDKQGTIIGSTVCLDNLFGRKTFHLNTVTSFLKSFDVHIKYLILRYHIDFTDFEIDSLMIYVKICLSKLPNVEHFKLVFCIDKDQFECIEEEVLQAIGNKTFSNYFQPNNFPKLENLVSLELDIENWEGRAESPTFLQKFSDGLIQPYSGQLKQLRILTSCFSPDDFWVFPNLVQLSIPQSELHKKYFTYQQVEKCTITGYTSSSINFYTFQRLYPKLTYLGFKFEDLDDEIIYWSPSVCSASFRKLSGVLTLELENCEAVSFKILDHFPNLQYIKLINKHTSKQMGQPKNNCLDITKLWNGVSLYNSKEFWEHFPNISLVTLEFSGGPLTNIESKLVTWTRKGYKNYWCTNLLQ